MSAPMAPATLNTDAVTAPWETQGAKRSQGARRPRE